MESFFKGGTFDSLETYADKEGIRYARSRIIKMAETAKRLSIQRQQQFFGAPEIDLEDMGMVVMPCSIKTLSAVANCYAADLLSRAADVTLKEGRPLLLVVRETPLHRGHIRLMDLASQAGATIFPPVPAFYTRPQTVEEIVDNTVGRVLARLGIPNPGYTEWQGMEMQE